MVALSTMEVWWWHGRYYWPVVWEIKSVASCLEQLNEMKKICWKYCIGHLFGCYNNHIVVDAIYQLFGNGIAMDSNGLTVMTPHQMPMAMMTMDMPWWLQLTNTGKIDELKHDTTQCYLTIKAVFTTLDHTTILLPLVIHPICLDPSPCLQTMTILALLQIPWCQLHHPMVSYPTNTTLSMALHHTMITMTLLWHHSGGTPDPYLITDKTLNLQHKPQSSCHLWMLSFSSLSKTISTKIHNTCPIHSQLHLLHSPPTIFEPLPPSFHILVYQVTFITYRSHYLCLCFQVWVFIFPTQ